MGEMADWSIQQGMEAEDYEYLHPEEFMPEYIPMRKMSRAQYKNQQTLNSIKQGGFTMPGFSIDLEKKKCVSPICRGSYVNILEPRPLPQSETMAWGLQCLFPKNDPDVQEWVKALNPLYGKVLVDKFGQGKAQEVAKTISILRSFPLRDGDRPEDVAKIKNSDELAGHYFMNTNNRFRQPYVIGAMGKPVDPASLTVDDIYSGAWYRVMLEFWYYDTAGNKGISTSIAALMKVKDDTNLGSGTSTTEVAGAFESFKGEAVTMFESTPDNDGGTPEGLGLTEKASNTKPDPADDFDFM